MGQLRVVGDVHGHLDRLRYLLRMAGVVDAEDGWTGGGDTLVVLGDLVDRGPDGLGVIELLMTLERQAPNWGGQVHAVLGNHEVQLLAAACFGELKRPGSPDSFRADWLRFGGVQQDLDRLQSHHVEWLQRLPAMVLVDDDLLVHADSTFYWHYGETLADVNAAFRSILQRRSTREWDALMRGFVGKRAYAGEAGAAFLDSVLQRAGARRVIHGHSPIARILGRAPASIVEPLVYADGRVVNVDHGLYLGGAGFVFDAGRVTRPVPMKEVWRT